MDNLEKINDMKCLIITEFLKYFNKKYAKFEITSFDEDISISNKIVMVS